jgi:hypothetical protein
MTKITLKDIIYKDSLQQYLCCDLLTENTEHLRTTNKFVYSILEGRKQTIFNSIFVLKNNLKPTIIKNLMVFPIECKMSQTKYFGRN